MSRPSWSEKNGQWAQRSGSYYSGTGDSANRASGSGDIKKVQEGDSVVKPGDGDGEEKAWEYQVVISGMVKEEKEEGVEKKKQEGEEGGTGEDKPHPFEKKGGKKYPCAECGIELPHRDMMVSKRAKHGKMKEVAPDCLRDERSRLKGPDMQIIYLKICAQCELRERRAEGMEANLWDVQVDIRRHNRGKEWNARGMFYKQAYESVDDKSMDKDEAKRLKTETCRKLAKEFVGLLKDEKLFDVFADAGKRMQQALEQWKIIDRLVVQLEEVNSQRDMEFLEEKLRQAERRWDEMHGYVTFQDKGELQYKFIKAQDYDDRVSESISRFYACPHCGTYFFSKFWVKRLHRWYCELDWAKWRQLADEADVKRLKELLGPLTSDWPKVGCGRLHQPWAKGPGLIIEYKTTIGTWSAFRADLMPEILDDCIKSRQLAWNRAAAALTPEQVYDLIPRTYPKTNPVALADYEQFPGIGRFDFIKWQQDNAPVLTTSGWCQLAMRISADNPDLQNVFDTAQSELRKRGLDYEVTQKSDAVGPLTRAVYQEEF
jgi:hypothetical protein